MPVTKPKAISAASEATVLTKAVLRAAEHLGMTNKSLATVIGLSEATVSRMRSGDYTLQRGQKSFELAILFVRFYRSLDAIVGGDQEVARAWLEESEHGARYRTTHFDPDSFRLDECPPLLGRTPSYRLAGRNFLACVGASLKPSITSRHLSCSTRSMSSCCWRV